MLSTEEREKLEKVLKKAEEFQRIEELELMRQRLEGQLMKFTNAFQGWQPRWFVLDPQAGELRYFLKEEHKQLQKQRGSMLLAGAVVSPSDEDSLAFSITPTAGDAYKLKAADTRRRQEWINRLRTTAEDHREKKLREALMSHGKTPELPDSVRRGTARESAVFHQLHRVLTAAADQQEAICRATDSLSLDQSLENDVLLLKATSRSILTSLEQCHSMLMQFSRNSYGQTIATKSSVNDNINVSKVSLKGGRSSSSRSARMLSVEEVGQDALAPVHFDHIKPEDEIVDDEDFKDPDLGSVDEHKTLILSLLSRLKLGTDLTKISFPVFVCQSRSFLECCSNFFANAELFVSVPDQATPETRMLQLLKWYLSSFYSGCNNGSARKPLNPVLGEIFRCTWIVPSENEDSTDALTTKINFLAEQVSHHPPVTAFYAHCPEKNMYFSGSVWPNARFMGMSFSCTLVGEIRLVLGARPGRRAECYNITLPSAHARSILTTPWFELSGKINISCLNSGVTAAVTFHTKPFYGGKLHKINSEIKNCNGQTVCRCQGEWNRSIEFTFPDGRSEVLSVGNWKGKRRIRPVAMQHSRESRRIWEDVIEGMRCGDMNGGELEKKGIEDAQRIQMRRMKENGKQYCSENFQQIEGGGWIWKEFPGIFDE